MDGTTDRYADWDAAYVLGALSAQERREFEGHLLGCARCSTAVTELAGLPSLLSLVPADSVSSEAAPTATATAATDFPLPDTMLPSLLAQARQRSRRLRRSFAAGSAVLVAAAVLAALLLLPGIHLPGSHGAARPPALALDQVVSSPIHARIRLVAQPWGTRVEVDCHYDEQPPPGVPTDPTTSEEERNEKYHYSLVITDHAGVTVPGASWVAGPGSTSELTGSTSLAVPDIARVQLLGPDGQVLLQLLR